MTDLRTLSYAELAHWLRDDVAPKPAIIREEVTGSKFVALASACVEDIEDLAKEFERRAGVIMASLTADRRTAEEMFE